MMCNDSKPRTFVKKHFKRENKNRPMEMSSKKRPPKLRQIVEVKKNVINFVYDY